MTKVERLEKKIDDLQAMRDKAMLSNDIVNYSRCIRRIEEVKKELEEARLYEPHRLSEELDGKGEEVKNAIYKCLIKCSLAADFVNDCAFDTKCELKKINLTDYNFRSELEELCRLSQKIASMVILDTETALSAMMTGNKEFIEACHKAADDYLQKTIKL
jgi:hypothetical protein